ncbi:MAG: hypothetical protein ACKOZW_05445, partial [Cyanobium sp.]
MKYTRQSGRGHEHRQVVQPVGAGRLRLGRLIAHPAEQPRQQPVNPLVERCEGLAHQRGNAGLAQQVEHPGAGDLAAAALLEP